MSWCICVHMGVGGGEGEQLILLQYEIVELLIIFLHCFSWLYFCTVCSAFQVDVAGQHKVNGLL